MFIVSKGVLKNNDQVKELQDKVNRLESEVTVLQTAFAGLVHRINHMERSFQGKDTLKCFVRNRF